jgi:hypothetical protein
MKQSLSVVLLLACFCLSTFSQSVSSTTVPKDEVNKCIRHYQQSSPDSFVQTWMREMPAPIVKNVAFRKRILDGLPPELLRLRVKNKELEEAVAQVLGPVLALYNRARVYEIIIVRHPTPMVMSDSGVALIITTGMLERTSSDDLLLGIVAHEIGHEYNAQRSHDLKQQYRMLSDTPGSGILLNDTLVKLAHVELDCDAFSAMTLAVIGRNPAPFANHLISIGKEYKEQLTPDHPSAELRARIITSIVPKSVLDVQPQVTKQLLVMNALLAQQR